jgi:hypothetical protein
MRRMSELKILYKLGDITDPCGTPAGMSISDEKVLFMNTWKLSYLPPLSRMLETTVGWCE